MAVEPLIRQPAPEAESIELPASEQASSHVRARAVETSERAAQRVAEYLRALGLCDPTRIEALTQEICGERGALRPELAVAQAQTRVQRFWDAVFGDTARSVDPLWLRNFLAAHPGLFLKDVAAAQRAVLDFGDPHTGRAPTRAAFREQAFERMGMPRWALGLLPSALITLGASGGLLGALMRDGLSALEVVWTGLFALLFGLGAIGMSVASYGFLAGLRRRAPMPRAEGALPRTALLMPIYHESAEHVFAALAAMRESLASVPGGECFEIFVLSDSRDAERAAEEERAFRRVASDPHAIIPIYYRRRAKNERQKAGNLAEFFERWGHRYTYAVVLDADSLMRGDTLVELVRRMHASPKLALLQAPLSLHRATTLFARAQQLVASVSGPIFTRGLALWAGPHGNYYGHNAIVRVQAFLDCCALPELRGEPPLGGHILSHDFVEAALLCRAGWEVRIADDLSGSWEELPPTLPEYVARDRRWCQGNMQHLRIAMSRDLRTMSRLHMLVGAASYLAGPAWLAFVASSVALAHAAGGAFVSPLVAGVLAACTAVLLLGPRFLGVLSTLRSRQSRRQHGGALRLLVSAALEAVLAGLLAPLLMFHHTRIVSSIFLGRSVRWGAQKRRAQGELSVIVQAELPATLLGIACAAGLAFWAPGLLLFLSPIWLPLSLAIPLALLASSNAVGTWLAAHGLLSVPSETSPDEIVQRADDLRALTASDEAARFRDLVLDPVLMTAHVARLEKAASNAPATPAAVSVQRLCQRALRGGPAVLTPAERQTLIQDPASLRFLHREAWRHWPVETWRLAREQPQLPPETA